MPDPQLGWSIALGPWKQLPLNLFVLWMAGNTISLFPIMMVGMMFVRPVQSLFSYKDGRSTSILSITSLATMNIPRVRCSMLFFLLFLSFSPSSPVFHKLQGDQALLQKVVYVLANLVGVGLAVYKFNNMGLLPTAQSDWLEFMEARQVSAALGSCFNVIMTH